MRMTVNTSVETERTYIFCEEWRDFFIQKNGSRACIYQKKVVPLHANLQE